MPRASVVPEAGPADADFPCQVVPRPVFLEVLGSTTGALEERLPYAVIGGVGSAVYGRPRSSHDLDPFVRPEDASDALAHCTNTGSATDELDPDWIYQGDPSGGPPRCDPQRARGGPPAAPRGLRSGPVAEPTDDGRRTRNSTVRVIPCAPQNPGLDRRIGYSPRRAPKAVVV